MTTLKRENTTPRVTKSRNTPVPSISTTMGIPHSTLVFSAAMANMKESNMEYLSFAARRERMSNLLEGLLYTLRVSIS